MPRLQTGIQSVYIADGFADDCDELIHRCSRVDILSYETFCFYYKEMNIAAMYQGRTSNAEIAELSEEVLQIAKYYMVLDTSNFEASVAGLFLVYALLNLQPYRGFAPLRVTPEDLPAIARIERVARRERRLDVLYVLGSVLVRGPVQYHAAARERGLETALRKYLEGTSILDITGVRPKGVYFRQNEELDIIREMSGIFKRYSHAKALIPGFQERGLNYANDNLAQDLGTSLKRLINGIIEDDESQPKEHYDSVQEIKTRAMRGAVAAVKHLEPAGQRSPEKKSPQLNEDTKKQSKIKTPPKKPAPKSNAEKRKRARRELSSSDEELDLEEKEDKVKKPIISRASRSFGKEGNELDQTGEVEPGVSVKIDSLPPLITTESDGKLVEIEIIDEMKTDEVAKVKEKKKKKSKKTVKTEVEMEKTKGKTDDEIFKMPLRMSQRLRTTPRREMKQPILKSKFKKMGMLPVANFEEKL